VGSTVPRNDTGHPAQHVHSVGMTAHWRAIRIVSRPDSKAVSVNWRGRDSLLTGCPRHVRALNALVGEQVGRRG
jgi:hypothetical protein